MGRVRRDGFIVEWYIGDHGPRHVHVWDAKGRKLGRVRLDTMKGLEDWMPERKLVDLIRALEREGRL